MSKFWLVFIGLLGIGCAGRDYETIVIRGSDTEVNLVLRLAETYMARDSSVSIAVTGGGSGTGVAALINKKTDIANSSRAFQAAELELAEARGVDVLPIVFAIDALSFIVNESLPIDSLTLEQVRAIYTGEVTDWSAYGGPPLPISLYGRQGNSGTFMYVQEEILRQDYSPDMKQMNGSSQIVESIKQDRAGIGYVGIGYILNEYEELTDGLKALSIRGEGQDRAISPTRTANIRGGDYVVTRPLYQYLDGEPSGKLKDFLEFELSETGQEIVAENGYFPVTEKYRRMNQQVLSSE